MDQGRTKGQWPMSTDYDSLYPALTTLADAFRSAELRPSDVVEAHLGRIARVDGKIGGYQDNGGPTEIHGCMIAYLPAMPARNRRRTTRATATA